VVRGNHREDTGSMSMAVTLKHEDKTTVAETTETKTEEIEDGNADEENAYVGEEWMKEVDEESECEEVMIIRPSKVSYHVSL
jgi:hypothetical protein